MPDAPLQPSSWDETVELAELVEASGLGQEEVMELVALGALECWSGGAQLTFVSHTVIQARRAASLRDTFGLNTAGMALALTYLARIERLEQRLRELEATQP